MKNIYKNFKPRITNRKPSQLITQYIHFWDKNCRKRKHYSKSESKEPKTKIKYKKNESVLDYVWSQIRKKKVLGVKHIDPLGIFQFINF